MHEITFLPVVSFLIKSIHLHTYSAESKQEESLETNPTEQTLDEEKENKEKQKSCSKHDDSPKRQKAAAEGSSGVVSVRGLSNLGNTCFFNSVMQVRSQSLRHFM